MEDRLYRLESDVSELRAQHAAMDAAVNHLVKAVDELRDVVQEFRDSLNQGRGAVWLFGVAAAAAGSLLSLILRKFLG